MSKATGFYLNNPLLKDVGIEEEFTEEQTEEYLRCANSCEYFIEHYVQIIGDGGLQNFVMRDYQRKMVNTFQLNRFVITKMPRQSGKSTTVTSYILWKILFGEYLRIGILANNAMLAAELLEKVKLAYMYLPKWMQQGVVRWNVNDIELENGCKVVAAATKSDSIRGHTYDLLLLDEFAFVPKNQADSFFASVYPTIVSRSTSQIIIVSTPVGMNHFHKLWEDAMSGRSEYKPIQVHWTEVPNYDEKFRETTIKNFGEMKWRQEFLCEFLGSIATLINPAKIQSLVHKTPKVDKSWGLEVWEEPEEGHTYVITVDTSHGLEQDYSVFVVSDVTALPYRMVAKYRSNKMSPSLYPETILFAAKKYNMAYILPETNDIGGTVAESIHNDWEYENVLMSVPKGASGQTVGGGFGGGRSKFGVRMTKQVKRIGCSNFKDIIEGDKYILHDHDTIEEISTFVAHKDSWAAEEGAHDDIVMCLVIFAWLVRQPYFRDLTDSNIRGRLAEDHYASLLEDLPPAGFIDAGDLEIEPIDRRYMSVDSGFMDPKL